MEKLILVLAGLLVVGACGDDDVRLSSDGGHADVAVDQGPIDASDAGVDADVGAEPDCSPPYGEPLSVRAGGRLIFPRAAAWAAPDLVVSSPDDLTIVEHDEDIAVYVGYDQDSVRFEWASAECPRRTAMITVLPLEWEKLADWDDSSGPVAREYTSAWIHAEPGGDSSLYIYSGFHFRPVQFTPSNDMWRLDLRSRIWSVVEIEGAPFVPGARVVRRDAQTVYIYGGATLEERQLATPSSLFSVSYEGDEATWDALPGAPESPGSYTGSFVYDSRRDRWLSVCGADSVSRGIHCQVSTYSPEGQWTDLRPTGAAPSGRMGFHYAYDEEGDRIVIAGGQGAGGNLDTKGDAWALELGGEGPRWVQLLESNEDVRRRNGAFVFDPVGRRLILWGGTPNGAVAKPGLAILRLEPGFERWDFVSTPAEVTARSSGFATYWQSSESALFGFGNDSAGQFQDVYELAL